MHIAWNALKTSLFYCTDDEWRYVEAQQAVHSDQEAYWNHIGKTIFDINDNEHFVILTVCTCNKHEGLFYKYIDSLKYESYKVKKDDDMCEYSPCEELLDSNSYEFIDGKVLNIDFADVFIIYIYNLFIILSNITET